MMAIPIRCGLKQHRIILDFSSGAVIFGDHSKEEVDRHLAWVDLGGEKCGCLQLVTWLNRIFQSRILRLIRYASEPYLWTKWRVEASKRIRKAAGIPGSQCSISVLDGGFPPTKAGRSSYYTNKSGVIVHNASAYRGAWGKPIYHPSTIKIEVGHEWLIQEDLAQLC